MRKDHLLFILFFAAAVLYRTAPPVVDPDLWHEMSLAREVAETGRVPYEDSFAYTETVSPVVHHEWGAGMIAYGITQLFGGSGIVALRMILALLLFSLIAAAALMRKADRGSLYLLLPVTLFFLDPAFSAIRAQLYSLVLLGVLLVLLELDRRGKRWWVLLWIPLHLLWLNLHGGVVYGMAILFLWTLERGLRREKIGHLVALNALAALLLVANPYHGHYYTYLWRAVTMERPAISEWTPLLQTGKAMPIVYFFLSLALAGYGALKREGGKAEGVLLLAASTLTVLNASRMMFFYAVIWTALVPSWIRGTGLGKNLNGAYENHRWVFNSLWIACTLIFLVKSAALQPWVLRVPGEVREEWGGHVIYPVGAAEYLERHEYEGNLLVPFDWGAYLMWRLYPRVKVSMDSRYEVAYPERVFDEQLALMKGEEGWPALLRKYAREVVLVKSDLPLAENLSRLRDWEVAYADKHWRIFARKGTPLPPESYPARASDGAYP